MLLVKFIFLLLHPLVNAGLLYNFCGLACGLPDQRPKRVFYIYWNVPSFMCHKYDITFEEVAKFKIQQNIGDIYRGESIAIFYDIGKFPAMIPIPNTKSTKEKYKKRNGGIPQKGNIRTHLRQFLEDLDEQCPDREFSGVGVIDFERWRPIFRQNWGNTKIHKDMTIEVTRKRYPAWNAGLIENEATNIFEQYAQFFMLETLKAAKKARVKADWGYYGYPYCFNVSPANPGYECDERVQRENDKLSWLFSKQEVLLPSVYMKYFAKHKDRIGMVQGRVREAVRVASNVRNLPRVLPYWWFKYQDQMDVYVSQEDVEASFQEILDNNADGIIIWGSSRDVDSKTKCQALREYLMNVLGPAAVKVINAANNHNVV